MSNKAYEAITADIMAMLDKGVVPWRQPWKNTGELPANILTRKPYQGGNMMLLGLKGSIRQYTSHLWGTYKQIKDLGGQVRKGEKGTPCCWYSAVPVKENGQPVFRDGAQVMRRIARGFRVFNLDQCDGLDHLRPAAGTELEITSIEAQSIYNGMPKRPGVSFGGDSAYYRSATDAVQMPEPSQFNSEPEYWSTMFHELAHATGHKSRLGRHESSRWDMRFGDEAYSEEELVAEFASSFLCGHAGITVQLGNSAAYIENWKKALTAKPTAVARALSAAAKAADFILGKETAK